MDMGDLEKVQKFKPELTPQEKKTLENIGVGTRLSSKSRITGEEVVYTVKEVPTEENKKITYLLESAKSGSTKYITPTKLAEYIEREEMTVQG